MAKEELKYEEALHQLEHIVTQMENNELGIDALSEQLKKAQKLIKLCKDKLTKTDNEIKKILEKDAGYKLNLWFLNVESCNIIVLIALTKFKKDVRITDNYKVFAILLIDSWMLVSVSLAVVLYGIGL